MISCGQWRSRRTGRSGWRPSVAAFIAGSKVGSAAGGLVRLSPDGVSAFSLTNGLLSNEIRTLYLDEAGTLWIGTGGGGLSRMKNGSLVSFSTRQGLGDDTVSQILEDDDNRL